MDVDVCVGVDGDVGFIPGVPLLLGRYMGHGGYFYMACMIV